MTRVHRIFILAVLMGLTFSATAHAGAQKYCTTWKSQFVDSGFGEDRYTSTSAVYRTAKYTRAQVINQETGETVWSGTLDANGCTPELGLSSFTDYKFRQGTVIERGNRRVYALPSGSTSYGASYVWLNSYHTTGYLGHPYVLTHTFEPNWLTPQSNVAAVAAKWLQYYSSLEYPANTWTYVNVNPDFCNGTFYVPNSNNVCVDPEFDLLDPNNPMDHSTYKFVVAHEFGHRQADRTGGPLTGAYGIVGVQTTSPHPCNCEHFSNYNTTCVQGKSNIGKAEKEGWAFFYAASIFNNMTGYGTMGYWRDLYVRNGSSYYVDTTPPVAYHGGSNQRWMETYCSSSSTNRGITTDWMDFYWNLWTDGSATFTIDEMTDIWDETTPYSSTIGERWQDLVATVESDARWGVNSPELAHFEDTGNAAGVDH